VSVRGLRKPVISLTAATGIVEAIESGGGDADGVLRHFGLDRRRLANPQGFIPSEDFARLLESAAAATGNDCFGLRFGARFNPKDIGPLAYVILHSPTVGVALANAGRYLRVHNTGATVAYVRQPPVALLQYVLVGVPVELRRQHAEYSLAVALQTVRLMAGSAWSPQEVQFEHKAPADTSAHIEVFGAPVSFECPAAGFVVDLEFAERQIPAADARLYPTLTRYLDDVLQALPAEDAFLASLRRAIGETLRNGPPDLATVAREVALGARTLQRRLADAGLDFKTLVDDTRHRLALRYLADPKHTLTEVGYLLGYSETSAFNRAFRRWTGSTPLRYRRGKLRPS
jgi:AraC-like DNA-binding protein